MSALAQDLYRHRPISVRDYQRMAETGILGAKDRVELIEGEIIEMAPIECRHAATVNLLTKRLIEAVGNAAIISVQNPVVPGDLSEPENRILPYCGPTRTTTGSGCRGPKMCCC